jgi:AcrR family transcriptional regulator
MQEHKTDRRIQRTEQQLRQALVQLIMTKGYGDITVQDILDEANMGRSTFYAHFRDKEDLLLSGFAALRDAFIDGYTRVSTHPAGIDATAREVSLYLFQHANGHRGLFSAMIGKQGGEIIQRSAQKYLTEMTKTYLVQHVQPHAGRYPLELLVQYMVSSYLAILSWWLDQNAPYTPEEMNDMYWNLVGPGIRAAMGT